MDAFNNIMNLIFPPLALYALFVFLSTYQRLKSVISIFRDLFVEDVAGKVVLITGAASGIGESLAYEYSRKGAYLVLVDIRGDPLYNVAALAEIYGSPEVIPIVRDVSEVKDCERFIDITVHHFGRLDHLVTNAGVAPLYLFEDIDDLSNAAPAMDINFWGSVYCSFFARPHLRKSKGRIIVIASGCGCFLSPRLSFYCASKAAVISLYETLQMEFGSEIGITIVVPGLIDSESARGKLMTKDGELKIDDEMRDVQISSMPVESAETCTRAIIKSICRGERYLLEPAWIGSVILWRVFCPEATEWLSRWLMVSDRTMPPTKTPSKKILDLSRAIRGHFF